MPWKFAGFVHLLPSTQFCWATEEAYCTKSTSHSFVEMWEQPDNRLCKIVILSCFQKTLLTINGALHKYAFGLLCGKYKKPQFFVMKLGKFIWRGYKIQKCLDYIERVTVPQPGWHLRTLASAPANCLDTPTCLPLTNLTHTLIVHTLVTTNGSYAWISEVWGAPQFQP